MIVAIMVVQPPNEPRPCEVIHRRQYGGPEGIEGRGSVPSEAPCRAHSTREDRVGHEIDEAWIEQAIERYQRIATLQADFDRALTKVDVTVRSPDGLVEIVVGADGVIRDVVISEAAQGRPVRELSKAVQAAVTAAAGAAEWARARVQQDVFGFADLADRGSGDRRHGDQRYGDQRFGERRSDR